MEMPVDDALREVRKWDERAIRRETACGDGKLAWRVWGSGSPVLLIHGSNGSWTHWIRNLEALSAHHTLYVPDLPGHGDSSDVVMPATMLGAAELLWQGLDVLLPDAGQVDLLGFSLGSVLAECMATQRPGQVRNVVLLRGSFSTHFAKIPDNVIRWRGITDPTEMAQAQRHNLSVLMFHDAGKIDDLAIYTHTQNLLRSTLDLRPLLASRPREAFKSLTGDIHGISGEFDVYGGSDVAAQGQVLLQTHPQASFHMVRNAGHWAIYEAADTVNALLVKAIA